MTKGCLEWFMAIGLVLIFCLPLSATEFPAKPITLISPFTPGGASDPTVRVYANAASKFLGKPVIVENKPGGGTSVGPSLVVTRPPDGYTLGVYVNGSIAGSYHMGKLNFNPASDLTHIIRFAGIVNGLVVRADSPWKTIQEFIKYSKENPMKVSYGSPGIGTPPHLAMEELAYLAGGIQWIHIPQKGGNECVTSLLGGHVDAISVSSAWGPLVESGKFRLLATYVEQRPARYSQAPTLKEVGYDMSYFSPISIIGPKGIPEPIVKKLHEAFKGALNDPEFLAILKKFDMLLLYLNSEDSEKADLQESEKLGRIVRKLGLQMK